MNTKTHSATIAYTTTSQPYPVDTLTPKPVYNTFQDLWNGSARPSLTVTPLPASGETMGVGAGMSSCRVYASVHGMSAIGTNAEWYLIHITPLGEIFQFQLDGTWVRVDAITSLASFPIFTFNDVIIYEGELSKGTHIFMLAIDPLVNGAMDTDQWAVEVEVIRVD